MRMSLAAVAAVAGLAAADAAHAASSFTIATSNGFVTRIGPIRTANATLANVQRVFGRPSAKSGGGEVCRVAWRRLRLTATFAHFGAGSACTPAQGRLQLFSTRSSRFRTTRGVRPGSASRTIPLKHPGARFEDGAWTIASAVFPYGDGEEATRTITATARAGRVDALRVFVGAAGD